MKISSWYWAGNLPQKATKMSSGLQSSSIYRVDARGGTPIQWISQPYERLNSLAVSSDGARLAFNNRRDFWWRRGPNPRPCAT